MVPRTGCLRLPKRELSRAYWIGPGEAQLTVDDSVAARLAAGLPVPAGAELEPGSRALIRWLGADSEDAEPQVVTLRPGGPGHLIVCTDGLSHYLPAPADLAQALAALPAAPLAQARGLTQLALAAGGHDNIAVAVLPFPPPTPAAGGAPR